VEDLNEDGYDIHGNSIVIS